LKSLAAKIQLNNRLLRKKRILSSDIFDEILTGEKTSKGLLNKKIMIRRIEKNLSKFNPSLIKLYHVGIIGDRKVFVCSWA
jgi:hypothetical protein